MKSAKLLSFALILCVSGISMNAYADGKCSSNSDCDSGVSCIDSVCANAAGGKCYSDSDCGGAKCIMSKCASAPDGKCYSSSDCGEGSCNFNKCDLKK